MTTLTLRTTRFLALTPLLAASSLAHAMSCDEIMQMVEYKVPSNVIIDAMTGSGKMSSDVVSCLTQKGAPRDIVDAAKALAPAPAPTPTRAAEPEPEAPTSRFDDTRAIGEDLESDDDDAATTGDTGGCSKLEQYIADYKAKKYLTASNGLFDLIEKNTCPEKDTTVKYYLAKSLMDLGMNHSAQHYFLEVVKKGPDTNFFKFALTKLSEIASLTGNDYELLRVVGKIAPEEFPRQNRPALYYLMGRKAFEAGELSDAAAQFEQVPDNHPLYPRAQYFQGIIAYEREKLKSAVKSFRNVIKAEVPTDDLRLAGEIEDLKDLSYINIGRIYFGLQRFDSADKYYADVDRDSSYWPQSLFERGWVNFWQGDLNETLGLLLTVDSPYFSDWEFIPETTYLRALTYFNFCEYKDVERLITLFEAKYQPMRAEMKEFIERYRSEEGRKLTDQAFDTYFGPNAGASTLPKALFVRILRNRDISSIVRHLDMMAQEEALIAEQKQAWKDTLGEHLVKVMAKDRERYKEKAGRAFLQEMLDQYRMLDGLLKDAKVLKFEVADAQRSDYMFRLTTPAEEEVDNKPIDFATRTDIIYWPFNGEFWADELAYYRYTEQGSCK